MHLIKQIAVRSVEFFKDTFDRYFDEKTSGQVRLLFVNHFIFDLY